MHYLRFQGGGNIYRNAIYLQELKGVSKKDAFNPF